MSIPHNVGTVDRIIRLFAGIVLVYIGFFENNIIPDQFFAYLVGGFGIVNIVSAALSWCPLYQLINLDTNAKSEA